MAKKYKYRRLKPKEKENDTNEPKKGGYFAERERRVITPEQKKEYLHLFLYLALWIVVTSSIYIVCMAFEFFPAVPIYAALGFVLFLVYVYFNGGLKKIDPSKFEKPEEMGYDEFDLFLEGIRKRQKRSKYFLILFIPFPMILLMDYAIMVWSTKLGG